MLSDSSALTLNCTTLVAVLEVLCLEMGPALVPIAARSVIADDCTTLRAVYSDILRRYPELPHN